jgi:hypothetical protein
MKGIPQERLIFYILLFGALPLVLVFLNFNANKAQQEALNSRLESTLLQVERRNQSERSNRQIRKQYQDKDPQYIEKQIEALRPLAKEIEMLEKISGSGFLPDEAALTRRLAFLKGAENKLAFTESPQKSYVKFNETLYSLTRSAEIDVQDLRKILSRIEGINLADEPQIEARPQLIITEFRIDRKKALVSEVYAINLKILKRQYEK